MSTETSLSKKKKFNANKTKFKICYQFVKELRGWVKLRNEIDLSEQGEGLVEGRIKAIEYHLSTYFSPYLIANCHVAYSWKENSFDKYEDLRWITYQTNKKYGRNERSWQTANRIRIMMLPNDIPF